jgi:hypothetical protein
MLIHNKEYYLINYKVYGCILHTSTWRDTFYVLHAYRLSENLNLVVFTLLYQFHMNCGPTLVWILS